MSEHIEVHAAYWSPPEFMRINFGANFSLFPIGDPPSVGTIYALRVSVVTSEYAVLELVKIKAAGGEG